MKDQKVVAEVAESEFERWAEFFEIDVSTDDLTDEESKALEDFKGRFVKRVCSGALCVLDSGVLAFSPRGESDAAPMEFDEPTGALLSTRLKNDTDVQAARRALAVWTGSPPKRFSDMKLRDFNFCAELLAFFGNS